MGATLHPWRGYPEIPASNLPPEVRTSRAVLQSCLPHLVRSGHRRSRGTQPPRGVHRWQAEGQRDHRNPLFDDQIQLLLETVVVEFLDSGYFEPVLPTQPRWSG